MAYRFRRSIRLFPGVRLNLSRGGVSASLGVRGATVNLGKRGARATVGLPGTGLSYTTSLEETKAGRAPVAANDGAALVWGALGVVSAMFILMIVAQRGASTPAAPVPAPAPPAAVAAAWAEPHATVTSRVLNCHVEPDAAAFVRRSLPRGTVVAIAGRQRGWARVDWSGDTCWVFARHIR